MGALLHALRDHTPLPAWAPRPPSPVGHLVRFTPTAPRDLAGMHGMCVAEYADGSFRIDRYCQSLNRRESVTASARDFTRYDPPLPRGDYPTAVWPAHLNLLHPTGSAA